MAGRATEARHRSPGVWPRIWHPASWLLATQPGLAERLTRPSFLSASRRFRNQGRSDALRGDVRDGIFGSGLADARDEFPDALERRSLSEVGTSLSQGPLRLQVKEQLRQGQSGRLAEVRPVPEYLAAGDLSSSISCLWYFGTDRDSHMPQQCLSARQPARYRFVQAISRVQFELHMVAASPHHLDADGTAQWRLSFCSPSPMFRDRSGLCRLSV